MSPPQLPPQSEAEQQLLSQLIGTWRLLSYKVHLVPSTSSSPSAPLTPFGPNATGSIIYTTEGHVSMQFSNPGQAHHKSNMPTDSSDAELVESARRYLAYSGPFHVTTNATGEVIVVHQPEVSSYPNWLGTDQRRLARMEDGGDTLALTPEKVLVMKVSLTCRLDVRSRAAIEEDDIDFSVASRKGI